MKPINKFNNGNGATICHKCNCIISIGFTDDLYCKECIKEQGKKMYSEEEVENIIKKLMHDVHCGDLCYGEYVIDFKLSPRQWFEQFKNETL
jgi:hypothetical protein